MATRIDEDRSPESVTVVRGDTAMLVCTVINIGDKSVGITLFYGTVLVFFFKRTSSAWFKMVHNLLIDWRVFIFLFRKLRFLFHNSVSPFWENTTIEDKTFFKRKSRITHESYIRQSMVPLWIEFINGWSLSVSFYFTMKEGHLILGIV